MDGDVHAGFLDVKLTTSEVNWPESAEDLVLWGGLLQEPSDIGSISGGRQVTVGPFSDASHRLRRRSARVTASRGADLRPAHARP